MELTKTSMGTSSKLNSTKSSSNKNRSSIELKQHNSGTNSSNSTNRSKNQRICTDRARNYYIPQKYSI
ncbi:hypothetical protein EUTSA_v10015217mg [Eutrema salsugineum]|uniref:Uncharacterized protein n=1 Tax=Eutrema salsugineum TaxID=72664 RepID=V4LBB3_EUTSA|nr:hypothetical protein EUTSA_v10015217mg [Eutrema salsugineum]